MRVRHAVLVVLVSSTLALPTTAQQSVAVDAGADSWTIDVHTVPIPAAASDALRTAIEETPQPDVRASRQRVPQNEAQWLAAQKASTVEDLEELAGQLRVTIEGGAIEGVPVYRVTPESPNPDHESHLFLHVHGGAYVFGGGDSAVSEAALVASRLGTSAVSVDYRMPPAHPFPAAIDDVVVVYRHLLESRPAKSILIGGTSAGGGLSLASVHKFKALGLEVPGAIYAGTPWADLTKTGDTLFTNEGLDRVLVTYDGMLGAAARLYAGGHDLKDPLLSPVYGDFAGFPPTYLVTGTRDMFLSDTARTHRKLREAGVVAELNVYEAVSHADYLIVADSPESQQAMRELGAFVLQHLP